MYWLILSCHLRCWFCKLFHFELRIRQSCKNVICSVVHSGHLSKSFDLQVIEYRKSRGQYTASSKLQYLDTTAVEQVNGSDNITKDISSCNENQVSTK